MAQLCGSELDGLTVSQLEELERMQTEAIRCVSYCNCGPIIAAAAATSSTFAAGF